MTPNFALSLSFAGITLLHRGPKGWDLVAEVPLDSADLDAVLRDLRAYALQIDSSGLRSKVIIPNDQIKYVTLNSSQTSQADVVAALDGATPYSVDELAVDFERTGERTQIAAVARETLEEAEAFATEHAFGPVCFVAVADEDSFVQEVFFGPTKAAIAAGGAMPTRDDKPVVQTGVAKLPEPEPEPAHEPKTKPEPAPTPSPVVTAAESQASAKDNASSSAKETETKDVVFASRAKPSAPAAKSPSAGSAAPAKAAAGKAPAEKGPSADAPRVKPLPRPTTEPLFTRRKEPPKIDVSGLQEPRINAAPPAVASLPTAPPPVETAAPAAKGGVNPVAAQLAAATAANGKVSKPRKPKQDASAGLKVTPRRKPRFLGLILTAALLLFLLVVGLWANTLTEDGIAGWFSNNHDTTVATIDVPAVPADITAEDEDTATASLPDLETRSELPAPSALAPEGTALADAATVAPPLPIVRAPAGRVLSPAEADRIYAATGVYQRAPRMPLVPRTEPMEEIATPMMSPITLDMDGPDLDVAQASWTDLPLGPQANPPAPDMTFQRDLRGFILATPEGIITPYGAVVVAGPPSVAPPLRPGTEVVAPAAEPANVAAASAVPVQDGLRLVAGPPPLVPPVRPEGLAPANTPEVTAEQTPEQESELSPELAPAASTAVSDAEAPASTKLAPDDTATTDAGSDNVILATGPPEITPPLRPAALSTLSPQSEDVTAAVTAGAVALASFRPALRPQDAVPPSMIADPRLAGFRPTLRPVDLAPEAAIAEEAESPIVDISAVAAAIANAAPPSAFVGRTAQAIGVSPRPDPRPRNFAQVVARSQAVNRQQQQNNAARQASAAAIQTPQAATTAVAPTTVAPSGNVPGGVAQAATMENSIRLRDMNLIGVYGKPNARRALVRMGNGRYVKVEVGSTLDGGRVTAIGDSALNFVKRGQTYALQLPRG